MKLSRAEQKLIKVLREHLKIDNDIHIAINAVVRDPYDFYTCDMYASMYMDPTNGKIDILVKKDRYLKV